MEDYEKTLGQLESVDLRFEWDQDGAWIVCRDTGVGMSKTIIENYFLVSGRSTRRHLRELQRDCVREGFSFIRSGQFGIGVLSFFMLANKVIIRTRRCQECGEGDTDGWLFETEGIGTFGELRTDDSCEPGTEVRLHLRQDVVGDDPQNWYRQLLEFVKRVLVRIPCVFSLTSSLPNAASFSSQAGWTRSTEDLINLCLESAFTNRPTYRELPLELLPDTEKVRREEERQYFAQLTKDVKANLKFIVSEGSLPDGIGKFRIHIPYFEPEGGLSLVFLRIKTAKKEHELGHVGEARGFALSGYSLFAWRGIQVSRQTRLGQSLSSPYLERSGIMEIDFVSPEAGQIGVDRRTITVLREGTSALWYTRQKRQQSLSNLVASHGRSIYATLNSMHGNVDPPSTMDFYWVKYKTPNRAIWTRFKLPITNSGGWCGHRTSLLMNKIQVTVLPPFPILKKNKRTNWIGVTTPPSMVTYLRTDEMSRPSVVPVWKEPIPSRSSRCPAGRRAQFPSEWSDFCGAKFISGALDTGAIVWNPENRLVKLLNWDTWRWCETTFEKLLDHRPHRDRLLQDPHAGAAWIIHCINAKLSELWDAIRERDPSFLSALWQSISEESGAGSFRVVRLWQEGTPSFDDDEADPDETQVWEITPEGWKVLPMASATELEYHTYLPKPNSAFCLEGSSVKTN